MKKVFPLLLCYVLTTAQMFALSGGPVFGSNVNVTGTYSGLLQGVTETDTPNGTGGGAPPIPGDPLPGDPGDVPATTASNALGLFSLAVPSVAVASGSFLLFANGTVFTGTITAAVDPDSATLTGVLQGSFNFSLAVLLPTGSLGSVDVTATALGGINAKIRNSRPTAVTSQRLSGTATLGINFGQVDNALEPVVTRTITFNVNGFKQTTAISTTSVGTATGSTGGGSGGGTT